MKGNSMTKTMWRMMAAVVVVGSVASTVAVVGVAGAVEPALKTKGAAAAAGGEATAKEMVPGKGKLMATFVTSMGELKCELYEEKAPKTVANFVGLATGKKEWTTPQGEKVKKPLYNGTIFHRVIPNFMIQGGDPEGTGRGGPGYRFADEFAPGLKHDAGGYLSMANAGPNTNGSQFFVTEKATPWLDGRHAIFGKCDADAVKLVEKITRVQKGPMDRPKTDVVLKEVKVFRR